MDFNSIDIEQMPPAKPANCCSSSAAKHTKSSVGTDLDRIAYAQKLVNGVRQATDLVDQLNKLNRQTDARCRELEAITQNAQNANIQMTDAIDEQIAKLHENISQASQTVSEQIANLHENTSQASQAISEQMAGLHQEVDRASQRSEHLEIAIHQVDKFHLEIARQTRSAQQAKRDLEKLLRRFEQERNLADASIERLRQAQLVENQNRSVTVVTANEKMLESADSADMPMPHSPEQCLDILDGIRQAMSVPQQPLGKLRTNRGQANHSVSTDTDENSHP